MRAVVLCYARTFILLHCNYPATMVFVDVPAPRFITTFITDNTCCMVCCHYHGCLPFCVYRYLCQTYLRSVVRCRIPFAFVHLTALLFYSAMRRYPFPVTILFVIWDIDVLRATCCWMTIRTLFYSPNLPLQLTCCVQFPLCCVYYCNLRSIVHDAVCLRCVAAIQTLPELLNVCCAYAMRHFFVIAGAGDLDVTHLFACVDHYLRCTGGLCLLIVFSLDICPLTCHVPSLLWHLLFLLLHVVCMLLLQPFICMSPHGCQPGHATLCLTFPHFCQPPCPSFFLFYSGLPCVPCLLSYVHLGSFHFHASSSSVTLYTLLPAACLPLIGLASATIACLFMYTLPCALCLGWQPTPLPCGLGLPVCVCPALYVYYLCLYCLPSITTHSCNFPCPPSPTPTLCVYDVTCIPLLLAL